MKNDKIKISVLMSTYNGKIYLKDCMNSILKQTHKKFEFIIIEDGSKDKSLNIIKSFNDKRIKLIINKKNIGLSKSLNKGLKIATGKYIARIDADDISKKNRLKYQLDYLEKNKDIGVLGTDIVIINEEKKTLNFLNFFKIFNQKFNLKLLFYKQKPDTHERCLWFLLFKNCFYHSTVMFRKNLIKSVGGYKIRRSEDIDFLLCLIRQVI